MAMVNIEDSTVGGTPSSDKGEPQPATQVQPGGPESRQLLDGIASVKQQIAKVIDDVMKPAVTSSFRYFDADPRFEAILSTPLLVGLSLAGAIFSLSGAVLVLWTSLAVVAGIFFLILVQLISLAFNLFIAAFVAILIAGSVTTACVIFNATFHISVEKIRHRVAIARNHPNPAQQPLWDQIVVYSAMTFNAARTAAPVVRSAWTGIVPMGKLLFSLLIQLAAAMKDGTSHQSAAGRPEAEPYGTAEPSAEPTATPAPITTMPEASSRMELPPTASSGGMKRREPYAGEENREETVGGGS